MQWYFYHTKRSGHTWIELIVAGCLHFVHSVSATNVQRFVLKPSLVERELEHNVYHLVLMVLVL